MQFVQLLQDLLILGLLLELAELTRDHIRNNVIGGLSSANGFDMLEIDSVGHELGNLIRLA